MAVVAKASRRMPMAGIPMAEMAAQMRAVPVVEIVPRPMMAMAIVVTKMTEVMAVMRPVTETRPEAAMRAAEAAGYSVDLSQCDREKNCRGDGEGFS